MGNHKRNKSKNRSNTRKNHILQVQNKEDATSNINYEQLNYMESHIKALYQKYLTMPLRQIIESSDEKKFQNEGNIHEMHKIRDYIKEKINKGFSNSRSGDISNFSYRILDKYPKWMFIFIEKELLNFFKFIHSRLKAETNKDSVLENCKGICLMWTRFKDITDFMTRLFHPLDDKMCQIGFDKLSLTNLSNVLFYEIILQTTDVEKYINMVIEANKQTQTHSQLSKTILEHLEIMSDSIEEIKENYDEWKNPILRFHVYCEYFVPYYTLSEKSVPNSKQFMISLDSKNIEHLSEEDKRHIDEIMNSNLNENYSLSDDEDDSSEEKDMYHSNEERLSSEELKKIFNELYSNGKLKSIVDDKLFNHEKIEWFHKNNLNVRNKYHSHECDHHKNKDFDRGEYSDEQDSDFEKVVDDYEHDTDDEDEEDEEYDDDDFDSYDNDDSDGNEEYQLEIGLKQSIRYNGHRTHRFNQNRLYNKNIKKNVQRIVVPYVEDKRSVDELVKFIEGDKNEKQSKTKKKKKKRKAKKKNDKNNTNDTEIKAQENSTNISPPKESQSSNKEQPSIQPETNKNVNQKKNDKTVTSSKKKDITTNNNNNNSKNNNQNVSEQATSKSNDKSKDTSIYPEFNDSIEEDEEIELFCKKLESSKPISSSDPLKKKSNHHLEDLAKWAREVQQNKFKNLYQMLNNRHNKEMKL